jgi:hypothetical protein
MANPEMVVNVSADTSELGEMLELRASKRLSWPDVGALAVVLAFIAFVVEKAVG